MQYTISSSTSFILYQYNTKTKRKNTLTLRKEIAELKKLSAMKKELIRKIPEVRKKIEHDQVVIGEELQIDKKREEYERRQKLLQEEINLLRDTLFDVEED